MSVLLESVRQLVADDRLRPLELALADWCVRHGGSDLEALALVLASHSVAEGHSCLVLPERGPSLPGEQPYCDSATFAAALGSSDFVGSGDACRPLVLAGSRLYLQRYWRYEAALAERLQQMLNQPALPVPVGELVGANGIFDGEWVAPGQTNWQAVAAAVALRHRLTVISGGPGTGKTYTVLRLIRLLLDAAARNGEPPPVIRLAAPTGKAAARMMESIHRGLATLHGADALRAHLPDKATTLHRLLGIGWGTVLPRFDGDRPLDAGVVIVDEASMVDLPLMAKLAAALRHDARLILLGDRYQLASVESGSVLAELCDAAGVNGFSPEQGEAFQGLMGDDLPPAAESPLSDHVVTLQTSHRFTAQSPIGRLAAAVNSGDAGAAFAVADEDRASVIIETGGDLDALVAALVDVYSPLHEAGQPETALAVLDQARLLTATRVGPTGAQALNLRIFEGLADRFHIDRWQRWYHGRPVIVLRNDYHTGLFNGDTGVCLRNADGHLRVWFRTEAGLKMLLPSSVPKHESAYAMTVHKSQGSEFERIWLLLPPKDNAVLTRELLYTGITRARSQVSVIGDEAVFRSALSRVVQRDSGLAERLRR